MKTLITSHLFRQFVVVEHPFLYFVSIFLMGLGLAHLASEISMAFLNGIFIDGPRMTLMILILVLCISISRYYDQKKEKNKSTQRIAT